jgi:hypothetical protein
MPLSLSSLSLAALLTVLVASSLPQSGASFQTLPRKMPPGFDTPRPTLLVKLLSLYSPPSLIIKDHCRRHRVPPLHSMVDMPMRPMKEEGEEDSNGGNSGGSTADGGEGGNDWREWKQVIGGFVPKFLRRRMGVEAASASAVDTESADGGGPRRPTKLAVNTLEDYKCAVVNERDSIVVMRLHASSAA